MPDVFAAALDHWINLVGVGGVGAALWVLWRIDRRLLTVELAVERMCRGCPYIKQQGAD